MKNKSFVVIGLGRFGASVANTLEELNVDVLAIDILPERVEAVTNTISHCIIADSTKPSVLQELGVQSIDVAVVAIGNNLQASILTVVNLKKLGVKKIIVRADEEGHEDVYKLLGATEVIIPEQASAISLANQLLSDTILDYYELTDTFAMVKTIVGEKFEPKNLIELDIRNSYDVNIVGILVDDVFKIPKGTDVLLPGNVVVVVGTRQKIKKFDAFLNPKRARR